MNAQHKLNMLRAARDDLDRVQAETQHDRDQQDEWLALTAEISRLERVIAGPETAPTRSQMPPGAPL